MITCKHNVAVTSESDVERMDELRNYFAMIHALGSEPSRTLLKEYSKLCDKVYACYTCSTEY